MVELTLCQRQNVRELIIPKDSNKHTRYWLGKFCAIALLHIPYHRRFFYVCNVE
jgi:hypothetical protein